MTAQTTKDSLILRQEVLGARRFSNIFWATISAIGGIGFLLASLSSYFHKNLLLVTDPSQLTFIPQGAALGFYGIAGSLVCLYLVLVTVWNVGGGYNEFDKESGYAKIFRWGYPGKNRRIEFSCRLEDIQSVRAEIKEGFSPKHQLYLKVKQRRDIPLTRVGEPMPLSKLENQGAELARFLGVPLEGI